MNILILTYQDSDFQVFKKHTLPEVNGLINSKHINITLVLVNNTEDKLSIHEKLDSRIELRQVFLPTRKRNLSTLEWFLDPGNKSHLINNLEEIIIEKTFDIIQLDSIIFAMFTQNIIALSRKSILVYRQYFDEIEAVQNLSQNYKIAVFKNLAINKLSNRIKSILEFNHEKFDSIITSSPHYIKQYNYTTNYFILPESLPPKPEQPDQTKFTFNLFLVAPLYLIEIQHGILWFLNEVWPRVLKEIPNLQLHLSGESEDWFTKIIKQKPNVHYQPVVNDMNEYLKDKTILLLPYDKTIGILPEFLQAIFNGKIIIAHTDAVHGWELTAMINFMPVRNSQQFIESILHIYQKNEIQQYFSKQILNFAAEKINEDYLSKILANFYRKLVQKHYQDEEQSQNPI